MADTPLTINLNLLTALDALLTERSVTLAAGRLGLSQPAVSAALARLRRHFDDPLLVRVNNAYELTPLAEVLRDDVAAALGLVTDVFAVHRPFDAARTERTFTLLMSDYALTVMGAALSALVAARAPHARLELRQHSPTIVDGAEDALRDVDGIVLPRGFLHGLPRVELFTDTWSVLMDAGNPMGERPTLDELAQSPWVMTFRAPRAFTPPMRQLELMGVTPRADIVVESFLAIPPFLVGTSRVAVVQARLVPSLTRMFPVRGAPLPFPVEPLTQMLWWHPSHRHDPAHTWLRSLVAEAAPPGSVAGV